MNLLTGSRLRTPTQRSAAEGLLELADRFSFTDAHATQCHRGFASFGSGSRLPIDTTRSSRGVRSGAPSQCAHVDGVRGSAMGLRLRTLTRAAPLFFPVLYQIELEDITLITAYAIID